MKELLLLNRLNLNSWQRKKVISFLKEEKDWKEFVLKDLNLSSHQKELFLKLLKERWAEKEIEEAKKENVEIIDFSSSFYPSLLKGIPSPPLVLYVKGKKEILTKFCFAIVGTRLASLYGKTMAEKIASTLASLGLVIVSGLARGIDTHAHQGALKEGVTVAVLGSGLLNIYPKENISLAKKITEKGAVISEFPLRMPPFRRNFPQRNRIISGVSYGVLVVEAPRRSGALITARFALEQNREVFALPGEAFSPTSKGTHFLIKEGAKLVDSLEDILEELNLELNVSKKEIEIPEEERIVFDIINKKGTYLEEIILKSQLKKEEVMKAVISLQMKNLIKEISPLCFVKMR